MKDRAKKTGPKPPLVIETDEPLEALGKLPGADTEKANKMAKEPERNAGDQDEQGSSDVDRAHRLEMAFFGFVVLLFVGFVHWPSIPGWAGWIIATALLAWGLLIVRIRLLRRRGT